MLIFPCAPKNPDHHQKIDIYFRSIGWGKTMPFVPNQSFCKVCFDHGHSKKQFTSHFIQSADGALICPTILNNVCLQCFKTGRFTKRCPFNNKSHHKYPSNHIRRETSYDHDHCNNKSVLNNDNI